VNAGPEHGLRAVEDLQRMDRALLKSLIHRAPLSAFAESIAGTLSDKPKVVHVLE